MKMRSRSILNAVAVAMLVAIPIFAPMYVRGQGRDAKKGAKAPQPAVGRLVTMRGTVVCLHTFVTGEAVTPEKTKAITDAIRTGAPVALETQTGLVILGQGTSNPGRLLFAHAMRQVKIKGHLYDKGGLKYLDFTEVKQHKEGAPEDEENGGEEEEEEDSGE